MSRDADTWDPMNAALVRAAGDSETIAAHHREQEAILAVIRQHDQRAEEPGHPIGTQEACSLVKRIKELCLDENFIGRDDWRGFLTGRCLTLRVADGPVHGGEFIAATVTLGTMHPEHPRRRCLFAIPAELDGAFGAQSLDWLGERLEAAARDIVARSGEAPAFPIARFSFVLHRESPSPKPEPGAVPLVLAPADEVVAAFAERAAASVEHFRALNAARVMLGRYRQPLGDALTQWVDDLLSEQAAKPDGRKVAQQPNDALRNAAIVEAICALDHCGMKPRDETRGPGPACDAVAAAFDLSASRVLDIWKKRLR